jgi:hypothetical protein
MSVRGTRASGYISGMSTDERETWSDASAGLYQFRTALIWRLVVVIVGVLYVAVAFMSPSNGTPGSFMLFIGVAEIATTVYGVVGLWRFAAGAPAAIGAGVNIAVACMIGVVGAQIWGTWVVWHVIQFSDRAAHATSMWNMPSIGDLMDQAKNLPYVQTAAGVAALVAVLFVLGAIRRCGDVLGDGALARRAGDTMGLVVILAIAYGAISYWMNAHAAGGIAVLLLMVAMFGIAVLASFVGVLRAAADRMLEGAAEPTLPVASMLSREP